MNRRHLFSLIELLVVIGIISLLAALLLPALGKAKDSARTMVCASNMHQAQLAMSGYSCDNNGYFRGEAVSVGSVTCGVWNGYNTAASTVGVGILVKQNYLQNLDCLWCPLDSPGDGYWNPPLEQAKKQFGAANKTVYCSYALDTLLMDRGYDSSYPHNYRLDKLPPAFPLAADLLMQAGSNAVGVSTTYWLAHKLKDMNVSYNDGAVTRFNLKAFTVGQYEWGTAFSNTTTYGSYLLWCRFQDNHGTPQ